MDHRGVLFVAVVCCIYGDAVYVDGTHCLVKKCDRVFVHVVNKVQAETYKDRKMWIFWASWTVASHQQDAGRILMRAGLRLCQAPM